MTRSTRAPLVAAATSFVVLASTFPALAAEASPPAEPAAAAPAKADAPTPAEKKGAYALPFALRPAIAGDVVRLEGTLAHLDGGTTYVSVLTAGLKPIASLPDLGFYVRGAYVHTVPDSGENGTSLSNPIVFGMFTPEVASHLRLALFLGVTAPIGGGGGNDPSALTRATVGSGIYARQAMDNALFATNYMTPTAGAGLAWIDKGFTAQVEATVLELIRARGDAKDTESTRTNFTCGASVGYRIMPLLTASAELHYQRWLSTPVAVDKDPTKRSQATFGLGLRANLPLSKTAVIRPGLAYFQGIDDPMATQKYRIVQLDVPIVF